MKETTIYAACSFPWKVLRKALLQVFFFIHDFIWNNNSIYVEPHCSATHAEFLLFFLQLLKHMKNVYFLPITSIWSSEHSPDKTSIWRSSEIDTMDWLKTQISLNLSYFFFFFAHSFHHTYTQTHTWAILFFSLFFVLSVEWFMCLSLSTVYVFVIVILTDLVLKHRPSSLQYVSYNTELVAVAKWGGDSCCSASSLTWRHATTLHCSNGWYGTVCTGLCML